MGIEHPEYFLGLALIVLAGMSAAFAVSLVRLRGFDTTENDTDDERQVQLGRG